MTNGDKIRSMSNEELEQLLNFIDAVGICDYMGKEQSNYCANPDVDTCKICVRGWLNQEI